MTGSADADADADAEAVAEAPASALVADGMLAARGDRRRESDVSPVAAARRRRSGAGEGSAVMGRAGGGGEWRRGGEEQLVTCGARWTPAQPTSAWRRRGPAERDSAPPASQQAPSANAVRAQRACRAAGVEMSHTSHAAGRGERRCCC
jgi:hypothetical protein